MKVLLQSPSIIHEGSPFHNKEKNVLIQNGKILDIGDKNFSADKIIKAQGMFLTIGWMDIGAVSADPGHEYREDVDSLAKAATAGGFTEVAVFPNTHPVIQSKNEVAYITQRNENRLTQLHPLAAVTLNTKGEDLTEMIDLHTAGAVGFTDGLKSIWHTDVFYKTLQYLQQFDGVLIDHPEDTWLSKFGQMHEGINSTQLGMKGIPRLAEEIILQRNIELLAFAGGRLHVNKLSSGRSAEIIKQAKKKLNISADVASYQLLLTDELLADFDTNYKVSPPLREASDVESLKKALREKTIEVICSGHHALDEECKNLEFDLADPGIIALQTVGANLSSLSEDIDWPTLLAAVTTGPRKVLKLDVPAIEPEQKASLTLFDPNKKWTLNERSSFSKSKNSPWWNKEIRGKAVAVWNNNKSWFDKDEN